MCRRASHVHRQRSSSALQAGTRAIVKIILAVIAPARPQQRLAGLAHAVAFWLCIAGLGAVLVSW